MKKWLCLSGIIAAWTLMMSGLTGCGGGESTPAEGSTVVTNGTVIVTNVTPVATLSGSWNGTDSAGNSFALHLTQTGDSITGTISMSGFTEPITGSISGDSVSLTYSHKGPLPLGLLFTTTVSGNANTSRSNMSGSYTTTSILSSTSGTWSASK